MSTLPAFGTAMLPAPPGAARRRRLWVLIAVAVLVLGAAGAWYAVTERQRAQQVSRTRNAEIAAARARVVADARARGVPLTAKAVAAANAAAEAARRPSRVADASLAANLFGTHSWYVPPPPPPPPKYEPPPPPPPPMAPPLPYVFLGSYTPSGDVTVYFLTRGDRVYDVKVGDTLDGIYQIESVANGQLVFNYKPLNQRQTMPIGAAP